MITALKGCLSFQQVETWIRECPLNRNAALNLYTQILILTTTTRDFQPREAEPFVLNNELKTGIQLLTVTQTTKSLVLVMISL